MDNMLKQSAAATIMLGPFVDDTDGVTAETGLTIAQADVRLSKNGGDIAAKNDATSCTHDEIGYYACPLDTTDTGTLGRLQVMVSATGALPVWAEYLIVPAAVYDSLVLGTDYLQADTVQVEGSDATNQIRDAVVDDATRIDASAINTLSSHDPGATIGTSTYAGGAVASVTAAVTVSDKTGYTLTSAYDPAKTAAQAGDKMDIVDVPNATAVTAIQSGLAPAGEYDTELDVAVSTRSSHSAADVWTSTTRTLSSFGTLVADTATAIWAATARTITDKTDFALTAAYDAAKTAAPAGEYDTEMGMIDVAISTRGTADPGDAMTLTAAYDAAKTAAQTGEYDTEMARLDVAVSTRGTADAGDKMDIIDAPNATAVTAIQSGLSTFAATDEVDVGKVNGVAVTGVADFKADVSGLAPAGEYDTEMAHLDADVSSRSSHTAASVWSVATRALTDKAGFTLSAAYDAAKTAAPSAADIATAVWAATTRTLSSYGTLVADIWASVARTLTDKTGFALTAAYDPAKTTAQTGEAAAAVATLNDFDPVNDTVAHVTLVDTVTMNTDMRGTDSAYTGTPPTVGEIRTEMEGAGTTLGKLDNTLEYDAGVYRFTENALEEAPSGSGATVEEIDAELTSAHGSGSWAGAAGSGANEVTVTVTDGTTALPNISVTIRNQAGATLVAGPLTTDADGEIVFNLDDGDYKAIPTTTAHYSGDSVEFTVASAPLAVTCEMTAATIPAATDPSLCAVYADMHDASGNLLGEDEGSITVSGLPYAQPVGSGGNVFGFDSGDTAATNASGRVQIELVRGLTYTLTIDNGNSSRKLQVPIPDAATYDISAILA